MKSCCVFFFSFRINNPEDITFHLLHLSLLREYIDWEFESLRVLLIECPTISVSMLKVMTTIYHEIKLTTFLVHCGVHNGLCTTLGGLNNVLFYCCRRRSLLAMTWRRLLMTGY
jgi:hypothetical protein